MGLKEMQVYEKVTTAPSVSIILNSVPLANFEHTPRFINFEQIFFFHRSGYSRLPLNI